MTSEYYVVETYITDTRKNCMPVANAYEGSLYAASQRRRYPSCDAYVVRVTFKVGVPDSVFPINCA